MPRKVAVAVALTAALILPIAGCQKGSGTGATASPSPSPSAKPAEILAASIAKIEKASFEFSVGDETEMSSGVWDAGTKMAKISQAGGGNLSVVSAGTDLWVTGFPGMPADQTAHVDLTRLSTGSDIVLLANPLAAFDFLTTASNVERTGPTAFKGTLDLTRLKSADNVGTQKAVDFLAKQTKGGVAAVPFTATIDDQGRFSSFRATFDPATEYDFSDYQLKITSYTTTKTVTKPSGPTVVELPQRLYDLLNSVK
jgi:hypothetical protein